MGGNKNAPKIRFKGFTDDWEQCKLEDIVDFHRGRGLSWNDIVDNGKNKCILYGNLYTDYGMVIDNVIRSTNNNKKDYFLSEIGDVLIPSSDTTPTGLARASALNLKGIVLGGDINVLRPKTVNGPFLSYLINNNKNELIKRIKGTTVRHLNNSDINNMCLHITNKTEEQIKISNLLNNIDTLITLHQNKCNKLIEIKKSMLEKMFPQDDEKFPKWRFKGFTDAWEQHKLLDIANYRNGKAHENDIDEKGKFIVVNSKFVSTEGEVKKYSNKQNEPLMKDEIAFVLSDVPNGRAIAKTYLVEESGKYTLNQRIAGITPHEDINSKFLSVTMNRNKYFLQFDDGVKQTNLSLDDMIKYENFYPEKEEQNQIGLLFDNIDNLIALHQDKCNKLIEIKKSLLEKMFV